MKTATTALKNLFASGVPLFTADLYTITLTDGTVIRYTSAEIDLTVGGNLFTSGPVIKRGRVKWTVGVDVDSLDITIADPNGNTTIGGVAILQAIHNGVFDGAEIELDRFFTNDWTDTSFGSVVYFSGIVGDVKPGRSEATITVNSTLTILNQQMPRNIYQPGCNHTLFDTGCTLLASAFKASSSASAGSTKTAVACGLLQADGYFALGKMQFTSGPNAGVWRTVKSWTGGVLTPYYPWPAAPGTGDTFDAYPGCDKTQATCSTKFSNLPNFNGYPYVPTPETALSGESADSAPSAGQSGKPPSTSGRAGARAPTTYQK